MKIEEKKEKRAVFIGVKLKSKECTRTCRSCMFEYIVFYRKV